MNKYQEAFTEIHHILEHSHLHGMGTLEQEHFDVIKALVEKETPMKPKMVKLFGDDVTTCPGLDCGVGIMEEESIFHKSKYCGSCSQKIDWSLD